jgi:hypothetical protein
MDETRKAPSPKEVLGHISPSSRRRPSSRKRASRPGPARSVARRCGRPCRSPGHACKGRHAVVCVAVRPHARLPREASMSVTQSAALSGGRRGRFASRPLACAPAGFDFWRIFGALGGQIWLARAKFVPYAAVYGTEGQRFESFSGALHEKAFQSQILGGFVPTWHSRVGTGTVPRGDRWPR